jgi:hypothetical protein
MGSVEMLGRNRESRWYGKISEGLQQRSDQTRARSPKKIGGGCAVLAALTCIVDAGMCAGLGVVLGLTRDITDVDLESGSENQRKRLRKRGSLRYAVVTAFLLLLVK